MSEATTDLSATDSDGRKLTVTKLSILQELDLIEAAGGNSDNGRWMMMATLACCVSSLNDHPLMMPTNRQKIRERVQLIGARGIAAVVKLLAADDMEIEGKVEGLGSEDIAKN